jgi:hypothetical protein
MSEKSPKITQPNEPNAVKGEYGLTIRGKLYVLKFTLNALYKFEAKIGISWQYFLIQVSTKLFAVKELQALLWSCLLEFRPNFSHESVLSLINDIDADGLGAKLLVAQEAAMQAFLSEVLPLEIREMKLEEMRKGLSMLQRHMSGTGNKQEEQLSEPE